MTQTYIIIIVVRYYVVFTITVSQLMKIWKQIITILLKVFLFLFI